MVGIKAVMMTSFKLVYVSMALRTVVLSVPEPMAGHHRPTPLPETFRHSQESLLFCFIDHPNAFDSGPHKKKTVENSQDMGIPDNITCLLRNPYSGQEATVRTAHETTDWFQIGNGVHQGCILSLCYLTYMQSTS